MAKLGQVFQHAPKAADMHPKWITTWIHYSKLRRSSRQYCDAADTEEIEHLADLICADGGVLQNLIVRKYDADEYEIIAGHKRTLACELLTRRGISGFEFLPCVVRNESEAKTRLAIVSSNAHHEKTPYETMHEMKELEYLFTHYPEEFTNEELKGRMVERIGRKLGKGKSVVNEYLSISKNLGEKGMEAFAEGTLNKDAAYALSGLPEKAQEELLEQGVTKSREIRDYRQKCPKQSSPDVPESGTGDFLKNYRNWNKKAGNFFYSHELSDGDLVAAVLPPGAGKEPEYYLLPKDWDSFADCRISEAELESRLKGRL